MCSLTKSGGQVKEVEVVARRTPGPMGASQGVFFFIFLYFLEKWVKLLADHQGNGRVSRCFFFIIFILFVC
jgi:hypothetical protein